MNVAPINGENLVDKLQEALPEFARDLRAELAPERRPGNHIVFGTMLVPWLVERLGCGDLERARRAFAFLEEALAGGDEAVANVVSVSLLYDLQGEPEALTRARGLMGRGVLKLLGELESEGS